MSALRASEAAAQQTVAALKLELQAEHKLCDQFRGLLQSLKAVLHHPSSDQYVARKLLLSQAFEEERDRRIQVEKLSGITSAKPTAKSSSAPPPPEFPSDVRSLLC